MARLASTTGRVAAFFIEAVVLPAGKYAGR